MAFLKTLTDKRYEPLLAKGENIGRPKIRQCILSPLPPVSSEELSIHRGFAKVARLPISRHHAVCVP